MDRDQMPISPPWPVIGHEWAVALLRQAVTTGRLGHAYLFTGPKGVGKGTLAQALAQAVLCTGDVPPCGRCRACRLVGAGRHPDLHRLAPQDGSLKIEQVRELERQLALTPVEGSRHVAILEGMEWATVGAANALLKTLEEPPPSVLLILLAEEADALLPTIVSRCQVLPLRPLPRATVEQALRERWGVEPERAALLARLSGGRLGWAVRAVQDPSLLESRATRLEALQRLLVADRVERFAYAEKLARDKECARETLALWAGWWRDLLILVSGAEAPLTNVDHRETLRRWAERYDLVTVRRCLDALQQALHRLDQNANPRLTLEVLMLDLPSTR